MLRVAIDRIRVKSVSAHTSRILILSVIVYYKYLKYQNFYLLNFPVIQGFSGPENKKRARHNPWGLYG